MSGGSTGGGSSGATSTEHIDPTGFPATCSAGLAGLTPLGLFDAIEIRVTAEPLDNGDPSPLFTVQETRGTPCAIAKDHDACMAAFAAATVSKSDWSTNANYRGGPAPPPDRYGFYVVTHADAVQIISTAGGPEGVHRAHRHGQRGHPAAQWPARRHQGLSAHPHRCRRVLVPRRGLQSVPRGRVHEERDGDEGEPQRLDRHHADRRPVPRPHVQLRAGPLRPHPGAPAGSDRMRETEER